MEMNSFEIVLAIIFGIVGLIILVAFILLIGGFLKDNADPENKSGWFGWIIAIIAAIMILYFYFRYTGEPDYRHSEIITKDTQITYSV